MKLSHPAPGRPITSRFGWRTHPITRVRALHRGVDFGGRFSVLAAGDGRVVKNGANLSKVWGLGYYVIVEHTSNLRTVYAHGANRSKRSEGEHLTRGDAIFTSGSTGASTGDHLHFEVRIRNRFGVWTAVDALPYLTASVAPETPPITERKRRTWLG
jgi:murein DD-endopeptidase MepM/ murein hydrolase activator NlpD